MECDWRGKDGNSVLVLAFIFNIITDRLFRFQNQQKCCRQSILSIANLYHNNTDNQSTNCLHYLNGMRN